MQVKDGPTRCSFANEYLTIATGNPDAVPELISPARSSARASAIAPLTPGMSQYIVTRRKADQQSNRRESCASEHETGQRRIARSARDPDNHSHKIKLPVGPEHGSRETMLQSLQSARASEENSKKRARLVSSDTLDQIVAVASSKKGDDASEGELAAQNMLKSASWRHCSTCDKFTVRIQAEPLRNGDKRMQGMQRGATRRLLLRYETTWREVEDILIESARIFKMSRRWTASYMDSDGDWIMLRNELDLLPFLLVAEELVIQSRSKRDQMPLITIRLDDE